MITGEIEQDSSGNLVPNQQSATNEFSSGLDRAELVTKHWDSVELPARGAPAKLGSYTRGYGLTKMNHWDSVELPARRPPAELGGHTRDYDSPKRL